MFAGHYLFFSSKCHFAHFSYQFLIFEFRIVNSSQPLRVISLFVCFMLFPLPSNCSRPSPLFPILRVPSFYTFTSIFRQAFTRPFCAFIAPRKCLLTSSFAILFPHFPLCSMESDATRQLFRSNDLKITRFSLKFRGFCF